MNINIDTKRISAESFFENAPRKYRLLEKDFTSLKDSMIWSLNDFFWKHYDLWKNTYGEEYETALPSGKSWSHEKDFIEKSARKFFETLVILKDQKKLPASIYVFEQGPGNGEYASVFLGLIKKWSNRRYPFYHRLIYILSDNSASMLHICRDRLSTHKEHIELRLQSSLLHVPKHLQSKVLFARHSNLWDQLPARIFTVKSSRLYEMQTRAIVGSDFKVPSNIEQFIIDNPKMWKSFIREIKLQTKLKLITARQKKQHPYNLIDRYMREHQITEGQIVSSDDIFGNLDKLSGIIDWDNGGYIEIVDIIATSEKQLEAKRQPLKFDGSVAIAVNGPLIKTYAKHKHKAVKFEKIHGLNTSISLYGQSLKSLLQKKVFVSVAEIAGKKTDTKKSIVKKAQEYYSMGIDTVVFSDQAHGWEDFLPINSLLKMNIFGDFDSELVVPVFATRRKTMKEIKELTKALKKQGIKDLFVVTGDPPKGGSHTIESGITSKDALPYLSKHFFTGAVAKPDVSAIPYLIEKSHAGASFAIVQSTYDMEQFHQWVTQIKKIQLHKKMHFIASLIPIVTKKTISAIQAFPDVPMPAKIISRFEGLDDEEVRAEGIVLAQQMICEIKETGIFSGVYIFSRSPEVVRQLKVAHV